MIKTICCSKGKLQSCLYCLGTKVIGLDKPELQYLLCGSEEDMDAVVRMPRELLNDVMEVLNA